MRSFLAQLLEVIRASKLELRVWLAALILFVAVMLYLAAQLRALPLPPHAAEESAAFRADYLAPLRLFQALLLAPLIETWLIVKGVDALMSLNWRGPRLLLVVALVAAVLHFFARGAFSALYNAGFFALMARIYAKNALEENLPENDERGALRPAAIVLILIMHIANNAVALGMIGVYSAV